MLILSQGNDNEFDSTDTISNSTSSVVPELNSETLTTSCLDFGHLISDRSVVASLTDEKKYQWLKNSWVSLLDFKFPMNAEEKKKLSFQRNWLEMYEWLAYRKKGISEGLCRIALLKFRIDAGDEILLASHIGLCDKNASYISKTTHHEITQCCGDVITEKIFAQLKKQYFTIMAYETTGISIKEQLAICIRYFDTTSYEIQEKFLKFFDIVDVSGENIARTILQELDRLNLDISYCRVVSEFLVSVVVLAEVFGLTLALARKLQAEYMDVLEAMKLVEAKLVSLIEQRYKSTDTFKKIFEESEKFTMEMGTQINKRRTINLQKN
ncbi:hypothetical protein PR048_005715 [Dryococelus australis]|uniref:Uncharacterized protein n=1 Tax=Dryococelus australis TaxID=614101 RepID=A0ABQ9I8X7_9NEOP|nr:hypothetical protein PR048_005715 [Dryococelus australis]